jgi:hypothetical protein
MTLCLHVLLRQLLLICIMPEARMEVVAKLIMVLWFPSMVPAIVMEATGDILRCVSAAELLRSALGRFVLDLNSLLLN